jgi:hypothetical protein
MLSQHHNLFSLAQRAITNAFSLRVCEQNAEKKQPAKTYGKTINRVSSTSFDKHASQGSSSQPTIPLHNANKRKTAEVTQEEIHERKSQ